MEGAVSFVPVPQCRVRGIVAATGRERSVALPAGHSSPRPVPRHRSDASTGQRREPTARYHSRPGFGGRFSRFRVTAGTAMLSL